MNEIKKCLDFVEHDWRRKRPLGPATWDAWCSQCGFRLEDKLFSQAGLFIEGEGRRLGLCLDVVSYRGQTFVSSKAHMLCSKCFPALLDASRD